MQRTTDDVGKRSICPITSTVYAGNPLRPTIAPSRTNGLRRIGQVETDWILTAARRHFGPVIGELDAGVMQDVDLALRRWLAL